jgi:hypothetical protein
VGVTTLNHFSSVRCPRVAPCCENGVHGDHDCWHGCMNASTVAFMDPVVQWMDIDSP